MRAAEGCRESSVLLRRGAEHEDLLHHVNNHICQEGICLPGKRRDLRPV
jgi:hypothetical protein